MKINFIRNQKIFRYCALFVAILILGGVFNLPGSFYWIGILFIILLPIVGRFYPPILFLVNGNLSDSILEKYKSDGNTNIEGVFKNKLNINFKNMVNVPEVNVEKIVERTSQFKRMIPKIIGVAILIWLLFKFVVIIDAGETGVYSLFGKVRDEELHSGFHLINPLAKITRMSIRTEEYTMSIAQNEGVKKGDDSIAALTKEGLDVKLDITVLYRMQEDKASDVYRTVGLEFVDKLIRPEIRTVIRETVAQYEAKELYSDRRQEAANKILTSLESRITPRGIIIENSLLRNVQLPPNLTKSIQEKLSAEQEAQKYDFVLDKEKKEADRKRIEAEGQRDAQKIINESLSNEYLNYLYIKELKDRPGTIYVPISPETGMPMFKDVGN